ncbi:MAG: hypothetical protein LQ347_004661 [Umbilicaria vellea]|nr:MAG: hypothetical protein LQ347_004661 [Umbilicaria vellea]
MPTPTCPNHPTEAARPSLRGVYNIYKYTHNTSELMLTRNGEITNASLSYFKYLINPPLEFLFTHCCYCCCCIQKYIWLVSQDGAVMRKSAIHSLVDTQIDDVRFLSKAEEA